jgi:hypothetical protein
VSSALVLLALCPLAGAAPAADGPLKLTVEGGTWGMFVHGLDTPVLVLAGPAGATCELVESDAFGQPTGWRSTVTLGADPQRLALSGELGYHRLTGRAGAGRAETDFGVVPAQAPGCRPESFFASNTSSVRTGQELKLLNLLGMRVQRTHFQGWARCTKPADGSAVPMNFDGLDKAWKEAKASGSWVLPIVAYAFENGKSDLANQTGMHGPPRDFAEFCATWEVILRRYPELTTYEFWNEPWIFGWTWAADAAEYRKLQKQWCQMALRVNPKLRLIAGNSSMFCEDHLEAWPDCWQGLLQGTSHHPYCGAGHATMRVGGQGRSMDHGMVVTRRMGLPFYYLTEGGTEYRDPASLGDERNNGQNARKLVHYHLRAALTGCYQANVQWDIGYGPAWTLPNTLYAVMTSFLEDRPCLADIWPRQELLWGGVFANPAAADDAVRALPRAAELQARWHVPIPPERAADTTKVAVVQALTGASNEQLDQGGTLTIAEAADLRAFDATGRPIAPRDGRLVLPLGEWPVYVTTDTLSVVELRQRVGQGAIARVTPVNVYAGSLEQPADRAQTLRVRVENQLNRDLTGRVRVAPAGGADRAAAFSAPAGALVEVAVPWPGVASRPDNQYGVTVTVETPAGNVERQQVLAAARFVKRTVTVDGDLRHWDGVAPVLLDSDRLKGGVDLTQYLLNPNLARPDQVTAGNRVVARLWSAYDDANVYLALAINQNQLVNHAGEPARRGKVELPYREGTPEGLDHVRNTGDSVMFAFGFRDRVPGYGRQMDDPWAWKGHFHDTDYQYVAHPSTDGPKLIRLWGADTPRRTAYQTTREPWVTAVEGAKIAIVRDEADKLSIYEMSLPRRELQLFDPAAGRLRFGFQVITSAPVNGSNVLRWAEAAGVFDHWYGSGSFSPSWEETLPCQTFFGIEPPGR